MILVLALEAYHIRTLQAGYRKPPLRFVDQTGLLRVDQASQLNTQLQWAFVENGVDARFLLVRSLPDSSLVQFAVDQARSMGVGSTTGERGFLCVYDVSSERMRIEVGPALEGVLTDAFVGYLERENTRPYLNADRLALGFNLTVQLIVRRLREAELGMAYDPRPAERVRNRNLLAEGAGATSSLGADSAGTDLVTRPAPPEVLSRYTPQATVQQAWELFNQWEAEPYEYTDVSLFTTASQNFLASRPFSRAYFDFVAYGDYGHTYREVDSGDLAMLVFTDTPFISPYYLRHTPDGWVMDIAGAVHNSRELIGNPYTWTWINGNDAYSRAFSGQVIQAGNVWRIRGGDNRALPVHSRTFVTD